MDNELKKIDDFAIRLKKIGIEVTLTSNFPWIYLDTINGKRVTETFMADHGFTVAFYPIREDQTLKFTDIGTIFSLIRKYMFDEKHKDILNDVPKYNRTPKVNRCPICHSTRDVKFRKETFGSAQGSIGGDINGVINGTTEYRFFCQKCTCLFDVDVKYWRMTKEEYAKFYVNSKNSGSQG